MYRIRLSLMVTLHEIDYKWLEPFVYLAFAQDFDLLDKYHKKEATTEECISNLIVQIGELKEKCGAVCYGVWYDDEPIGFSVIAKRLLYSFGIDIHFRQKDILLEWFDLIKEKLENQFVTLLYNENVRAINFFEKNGMDIVDENDLYKTLAYLN